MDNFTAAGMGHNQPPPEHELIRERLFTSCADKIERRDELTDGAAALPTITDDDAAGDVADFIKLITAAIKDAEATRVKEKEPHLAASRAVDGFFKAELIDKLEALRRKVESPLTTYLREKEARARREREEAAQREREAAAQREREARALQRARMDEEAQQAREKAAASAAEAERLDREAETAKPATLSRTRGDMGSVASLRTQWVGRVTDPAKVDLEKLRPYISPDSIQKALNLAIRAGVRAVDGCVIEEQSTASVR